MTDLDALAAGLSPAVRNAILNGRVTVDGRVLIDAFIDTPDELTEYYSAMCDKLSPLGLRLRARLLEE